MSPWVTNISNPVQRTGCKKDKILILAKKLLHGKTIFMPKLQLGLKTDRHKILIEFLIFEK